MAIFSLPERFFRVRPGAEKTPARPRNFRPRPARAPRRDPQVRGSRGPEIGVPGPKLGSQPEPPKNRVFDRKPGSWPYPPKNREIRTPSRDPRHPAKTPGIPPWCGGWPPHAPRGSGGVSRGMGGSRRGVRGWLRRVVQMCKSASRNFRPPHPCDGLHRRREERTSRITLSFAEGCFVMIAPTESACATGGRSDAPLHRGGGT